VVDLFGENYAPTYKRRAKGLVKSGRARWSDDNETEICLLVSPAQILEEDNTMHIYDNDGNRIDNHLPETPTLPKTPTVSETKTPELTIGYILSQMEKIHADNKYIYEAITQVSAIKTHEPSMNAADYGSQSKADAIGIIVSSRETTNQKLLDMYNKMYEDLRPSKVSGADRAKVLELISEMSENDETVGEILAGYVGQYFKEAFK